MYLRSGQPLRGVWLDAEYKIRRHINIARVQQNSNGMLSSRYFRGRDYKTDFNKRMASAGHLLEFLMIALPQDELHDTWVRRAIRAVAEDLLRNRKAFVRCSPLYHAVNALNIYRDRVKVNPAAVARDDDEPQRPSRATRLARRILGRRISTARDVSVPPIGPIVVESADDATDDAANDGAAADDRDVSGKMPADLVSEDGGSEDGAVAAAEGDREDLESRPTGTAAGRSEANETAAVESAEVSAASAVSGAEADWENGATESETESDGADGESPGSLECDLISHSSSDAVKSAGAASPSLRKESPGWRKARRRTSAVVDEEPAVAKEEDPAEPPEEGGSAAD